MDPVATTDSLYFNNFSNSAATASPTSLVVALPPISPVRTPDSITLRTAASMALASAMRPKEYCIIMAMERMAATGFTMPFPAMSGAEPA